MVAPSNVVGFHADDAYVVAKKPQTVTVESLHDSGRGVGYTRTAFAYLFTRVR